MKPTLILIALILIFLVGCSQQPRACTMEAKLCPDGSAVGRSGPNCEFAPCPATPGPDDTLPPEAVPPGP